MDNRIGQTPFTDEELTQALLRGTDDAARRQGIVWSAITTRYAQTIAPRRPVWMTLAACGAAVVLLVAVVWALGNRLPTVDIARPLMSGTQGTPDVYLSTNIQIYTPAMNSVQGITITARDALDNPVKGSWTTSWGGFLGALSEQGNLIPGPEAPLTSLQNVSRVMWGFYSEDASGVTEPPQSILITFTADSGSTATLELAPDPGREGFVRVVQKLGPLNLRVNMDGFNGNPTRNLFLPMTIEAVDADGNPVIGAWSTTFEAFRDEKMNGNSNRIEGTSSVQWSLKADNSASVPDIVTITFTATDGRTKDLHLFKDLDNPWTLRVSPQDLLYIPSEPAETHPVQPTATPSPVATSDRTPALPVEEAGWPTAMELPEWTRNVRYDGPNMDLATDQKPEKYLATPTQWEDQSTPRGTLRLPRGWSVSGSEKDIWLKLQDEAGREMGTLEYNWLDASLGEEAYLNAIANHTDLISFQKLQGYSYPSYRLLLEADNGTAASGITGVTVQSETVFIPGSTQQKDGKTYYEAYILRLYKARTGDGSTEYLLNNQTVDRIAQSWHLPTTGSNLTAQQTLEAYFDAWNQKDQEGINRHVLGSMKGADYEFDKLKSVQLLDCSDETQQMKSAFSKDWYSNPADIAVFRARFQYECKDPNGVCSGMTSGTYEMDFYLVKKTPDGPWVIVMWGNG